MDIYVGSKVMSIYTNNTSNPSTKYLHYDSLNSVDTITNNLEVVESRAAYKPFGEKLNLDKYGKATTKASYTNRGYTGHEHIEETKFINMNARLYDPTIARFMSADSIIPFMYDTQAFNRYTYVKNNPLKYTDPSGHSWLSKAWKKTKKWTTKNWRKIAGATLVVVGAAMIIASQVIPGANIIGAYIGGSLMTLGASLIKYNPNKPDSPSNEIRVDFPLINIPFSSDRGSQNQYTQNNDQGRYIVNNVTQGTHSNITGNKLNNGGDNTTYNPNFDGSITVGTITVSNSNSGGNVLAVDGVESITRNWNLYKRNMANSFSIIDKASSNAVVFGIAGKNTPLIFYGSLTNIYAKFGLLLLGYGPTTQDIVQNGLLDYITPLKPWHTIVSEAIKIYTTDN